MGLHEDYRQVEADIEALKEAVREIASAVGFIMSTATATIQPAGSHLALTPPPPEVVTLGELYRRVMAEGATLRRNTGSPRIVMP